MTKGKVAMVAILIVSVLMTTTTAFAQLSVFAPETRLPGQKWVLNATGKRVVRWDVTFGSSEFTVDGDKLELPLVMPEETDSAPLTIEAVMSNGKTETYTQDVTQGSARDALIAEWIALIKADDGAMRKSNSTTAPGQCKRYLVNTFAQAAANYELILAPYITLNMPEDSNPNDGTRVRGVAWTMPENPYGSPFYTAASYDFNKSATKTLNKQAARDMLMAAKPGDVIQMMALYDNGVRGTHTLLVTEGYDEETDTLYWADSNFKNKVIDGVRYGLVVANQKRSIDEIVSWLVNPSCGATLYRISPFVALREPATVVANAEIR